jgi:prepilin-type N-terminal cleavage/methylation domain-containing protein
MTRRGLTLIELLITLIVFGILGTALSRLMISNSRFVGRQEALLEARQTARAAMHVIATELRMVSDGGLRAASAESVTVRIPYVFGVLCRNDRAAIMPADSVVFASAVTGGIGYRLTSGAYAFDTGVTMTLGGTSADCTADSIRPVQPGQHVTMSRAGIAPVGTVFYMFQLVTYKFAASAQLPGRVGLWRRVGSGADEEILSPFASTARFAFLTGTRLTVQTTPPPTNQIQGLELRLVGESEFVPNGAGAPTQYALMPRIKFVNRAIQ